MRLNDGGLVVAVIILGIMIFSGWMAEVNGEEFVVESSATHFYIADKQEYQTLVEIDYIPTIEFIHPDGRRAIIDFGGDEVIYSGELPVAESAKLFFEAFNYLCEEKRKKE